MNAIAEAFPVGEYLRDEIEARDWSIGEFAAIIGRPVQAISEILNGKKDITPDTASEIAAATGTEAETWLALQARYKLWSASDAQAEKYSAIERRAKVSRLVPLGELRKRGFVSGTTVEEQEREICAILGIGSTDEMPSFAMAARRRNETDPPTSAQIAWLALARRLAERKHVAGPYDPQVVEVFAKALTQQYSTPESLERLPVDLVERGVRLVYVEPFAAGKIDGTAFFDDLGPVIAISGRGGRMDKVIFTLLHELAHLVLGHAEDGIPLDEDISSEGMSDQERETDQRAREWSLSRPLLITGGISRAKVASIADREGVHPAIVVGRLHYDGVLPWSHLNGLIPNVKEILQHWS
jgi:HTH-type transcriptional regulator/antitoxin HigA